MRSKNAKKYECKTLKHSKKQHKEMQQQLVAYLFKFAQTMEMQVCRNLLQMLP